MHLINKSIYCFYGVGLAQFFLRMSRTTCAIFLATITMSAAAGDAQDWWVDITNDRASKIAAMLEQGADPNAISPAGNPSIMQAIRDGSWKVYDVLVANPKTALNAINLNRETPLMYLAVIGETARAEDLIRRGAMVNRKGWTPLHYAASTGKVETLKMLLEHGAEVNSRAKDGTTPLMMAAYGGSEAAVRILLDAGADLYLRTTQDYDVLDWAGFKSHTVLARKLRDLMDRQADPTAGDESAAEADARADTGSSPRNDNSTSRYFDLERFDEPATP